MTHPRRRKGSLMIQQLILLAASSSVVLVATSLLHETFKFGKSFRDNNLCAQSVHNLCRQFRADVQQSTSIRALAPDQVEFLRVDSEIALYQFADSKVTRTVKGLDESVVRRDAFYVPHDHRVVFRELESAFEMRIEHSPISVADPQHELEPMRRIRDVSVIAQISRWPHSIDTPAQVPEESNEELGSKSDEE